MVPQAIHVKYNAGMKTRLGRMEAQMLAYLQLRRQQVVRAGELTGPLRLTPGQERELFRRLVRGQLLARVRPGLFLAPPRLPLGLAWTPSDALALNTLMEDRGGRYQICGLSAFNRYGFEDQVPNRVVAYNNRISGQRTVGAVSMILIKVADRRLGATERMRLSDGEVAVYSSRARALVDAVYDWARFATLPRAFDWIRTELRAGRVDAAELARVTVRYGDVGTIRRVGALLERLRQPARVLTPLKDALEPSSSVIPWIPTRPKRGRADRRWGIVWNDRD
jgi:predicted transcriptional regulator of viral defense system